MERWGWMSVTCEIWGFKYILLFGEMGLVEGVGIERREFFVIVCCLFVCF